MLETLHIHPDAVPFVEVQPGMRNRVLHARPQEDILVMELEAAPGVRSGPHRHLQPVFGFTSEGRWGHDEEHRYRAGTYVFETPGVIHRFLNAPDVTTRATFLTTGAVEWIGEDGGVEATMGLRARVDAYFHACEAAGLGRPNILR